MNDLTYDRKIIDLNPVWKLAFIISEIENDNAPIGWGQYISLAGNLIANGYAQVEEKENA